MKRFVKGCLVLGVLFLTVCVIAFAIPVPKTGTFWLSFAFMAAAFAVQPFIWKIALGRDESLKSKFLGFPVLHIGLVYLALEIVSLLVFLFAPTLPTWSAVVACGLITGVSALCMVAADTGRTEIERLDARATEKVSYIRELQAELELLAESEKDGEIKSALAELAEKVRFSDPMSHESLAGLESEISSRVARLKTDGNKAELIDEITSLLNERNKKCKMSK